MIALLATLLAVVTAPYAPVSYACDGSTAAYTVNFPYLSSSDLTVTSTTAGGAVTTLSLTTDYTSSVTSTTTTATITLLSPSTKCPAGSTLKISRTMACTQPQSFRQQTSLDPRTVESVADRVLMCAQQVQAGFPTTNSVFTYQGVGSGASVRSLTSKLGDVVSVKDFGAKGDGVTNDAAAFALALTAASTSGGTVFAPAGNYLVSPTIVIGASNVYLRGAGRTATTLTASAASGGSAGVISITAGSPLSNVGISDLGIVCTGTVLQSYAAGSGTYNNYGVYTGVDITGLTIDNIAVTSCGAGIGTTYPAVQTSTLLHNGSIRNSFFYGLSPGALNTHTGIQLIGDGMEIDNNYVTGFTNGLNSPPWSNGNRWTNNTVLGPANATDLGIYLSGAIKSIVSHNKIVLATPVNPIGDGCMKIGAYNDPHVSDKWIVSNNYCENGTIKFSRCGEGKVIGNTVNSSYGHGTFNDAGTLPVWNIQSITANTPSAGQATITVNSATSALVVPASILVAGTATGHDGSKTLLGTGTNTLIVTDATAGNTGVVGTAKAFDSSGVDETVVYCKDMLIANNTFVDVGRAGAGSGTAIFGSGAIDRWTITGNVIKHPNGSGIDLRNATDVTVTGNIVSDTVNQCIFLDAVTRGTVSGGSCTQTGTFGATPAVRLGNGTNNVSVTGLSSNNYARGIQVDTGTNDHLQITGNNLVGCGAGNCNNGIFIDGSCTFCNAAVNAVLNFTNVPGTLLGTSSVPGSIALVAGTITAGVPVGCNPWCFDSTAAAAVKCTVVSSTLTIVGTGTDVIKYGCH